MNKDILDWIGTVPDVDESLDDLRAAAGTAKLPLLERPIAQDNVRCPEEDLALLGTYTKIRCRKTRQAILDLASAALFAQRALEVSGAGSVP